MNQRHEAIAAQLGEAIIKTPFCRLSRQSLSPQITPNVIAHFDFLNAIHLLAHETTVTDDFTRTTQNHGPKPIAMRLIAAHVPLDPCLHPRLIKSRRVMAHRFSITKNGKQRRNIPQGHWAEQHALCLDSDVVHGVGWRASESRAFSPEMKRALAILPSRTS